MRRLQPADKFEVPGYGTSWIGAMRGEATACCRSPVASVERQGRQEAMVCAVYSLLRDRLPRGLLTPLASWGWATLSIGAGGSAAILLSAGFSTSAVAWLFVPGGVSAGLYIASRIWRRGESGQSEDEIWAKLADVGFAILILASASFTALLHTQQVPYFRPSELRGVQPGVWVFILAVSAFIVSRFLLAWMLAGDTEHRPLDFFPEIPGVVARQFMNVGVGVLLVVLYTPLVFLGPSALGRSFSLVVCLASLVLLGNVVNGFRTLILTMHLAWLAFLSLYIDAVSTRANLEALVVLDLVGHSLWLPALVVAVSAYLQVSVLWNTYRGTTKAKHRETVFMTGQLLIFVAAGVLSIVLVMLPMFWREIEWLKEIRRSIP